MKTFTFIFLILILIIALLSCGTGGEMPKMSATTTATAVTMEISPAMPAATTGETPADDISMTMTASASALAIPPYDPPADWGEWHLSPITLALSEIKVAESYRDWILQTPTQVTQTRDGLSFTFEFFREEYRYGEGLQVRVTVQNPMQESIAIRESLGGGCYVLGSEENQLLPTYFRLEQLKNLADAILHLELDSGACVSYEYLFRIDPVFFDAEATYTLVFHVIRPDGTEQPWYFYEIEVPLRVLSAETATFERP